MIFQVNSIQRKVGVMLLISDEKGFEMKKVKKDSGKYFTMIKGIMHFFPDLPPPPTFPSGNH